MNESVAEFAKALAAFQAEIPAFTKDQTADTGSYSYAYTDLPALAAKGLPLLAKHGLSWTTKPTMGDHGFVLAYSLLHTSGHREDGDYPLPDPAKHRPQELGSAITYARRYAFCSVTGIAPGGEDDDGNAALNTTAAPRQDAGPLAAVKSRVWSAAKARSWDANDLANDFAATHDGLTIASADLDQLIAYAVTLELVPESVP